MGIFDRIQAEVEERERREGITPSALLDLPPDQRRLINQITRGGEQTPSQLAEALGEPLDRVQEALDLLAEKGYLEREKRPEGWVYRTRFGRKRARQIPVGIWSALRGGEEE